MELTLNKDFKEKVDSEILRRVRSSVQSCSNRDSILKMYALQVDGLSQPYNTGPWNNSCQTDDPLTLEHVLSHVSWLMAATNGSPTCLIDAVNPDKEQMASQLEGAFNAKLKQWRVDSMKYSLAYNATVFPYAPFRVNWKQKLGKIRAKDEIDGKEVPTVKPVVLADGPDLICDHPSDVYLYPPNAQSYDKAEAIIVRMYFTAGSLWSGINDLEFDRESVEELIRQGPTGYFVSESERERRDMQDGTESDPNDGVYECYLVWGNMPVFVEDGEITTPDQYMGEDFCWMVCPKNNVVFKFDSAPYPFRPFEAAYICRYPNRILGRCVPQIIEPLQEEATVLFREVINIAEFNAQPVILKPESMRNDADAREIFPGAEIFFPGMNPGIVQSLQWNMNGVEMLNAVYDGVRKRASDVMGAGEGITQMAPGSPTATETNAVNGNSMMRRDLFLQTFLASLNSIYKMIFIMWLTHMSEEGEDVQADMGLVHVDKMMDIADDFIFTASANSAAGNPQLRLQQAQQNSQTMMNYIQGVMTIPQQYWPMLYHAARRQLSENGERSVESWIGKEPQAGDPAVILQQIVMLIQQAAQAGDPAAPAMLQAIASIQSMAPQQQGATPDEAGLMEQFGNQSGQASMPLLMPQAAPTAMAAAGSNGNLSGHRG